MCSRGRKQPLWRDLPGIIQRDPSPACGPEPTFHPEKRAQELKTRIRKMNASPLKLKLSHIR